MEDTMKINPRGKFILAAVALVAVAAVITFTVRADDEELITFRTRLTGFGEVPPKLANGSGTFVGQLSADGQSMSWTLTWTGLTGAAQVAHIHFGQAQNTGTPVVFFCNGGNRPAACPDGPGHSGTLTGTFTAADVVAVPSQNVSAGDFAGFVKILRAHLGYANIHTAMFGGGEIRGQVSVVRHEDEDN
jgi:hypothetical protein